MAGDSIDAYRKWAGRKFTANGWWELTSLVRLQSQGLYIVKKKEKKFG